MGGFFGTLTIVFVIAKIVGLVEWSWLVVFSPMAVAFVYAFVVALVKTINEDLY